MALLAMEGFDYINAGTDMYGSSTSVAAPFYTVSGNNAAFTTGRSGVGRAMSLTNSTNGGTSNSFMYISPLANNPSEFVMGFAAYFQDSSNSAGDYRFISVYDAAGANAQFIIRSPGTAQTSLGRCFELWNSANNTLLATATIPFYSSGNMWIYIELKCKIHTTTGYVEMRINGELALSKYNFNTNPSGTANTCAAMAIFSSWRSTYLDDFYVLDTTGSAPFNDYLGPVYINKVLPTIDGSKTQFTLRSGATTHWGEVDDDQSFDDDTTYVETNTNLNEDLYKFATQSGTQLLAVKVLNRSKCNSFGNVKMGNIIEDYAGANFQVQYGPLLTSSYYDSAAIFTTAPDGTTWDFTKLNATQFGVKMKVGAS